MSHVSKLVHDIGFHVWIRISIVDYFRFPFLRIDYMDIAIFDWVFGFLFCVDWDTQGVVEINRKSYFKYFFIIYLT